jgi:hypothetical protein
MQLLQTSRVALRTDNAVPVSLARHPASGHHMRYCGASEVSWPISQVGAAGRPHFKGSPSQQTRVKRTLSAVENVWISLKQQTHCKRGSRAVMRVRRVLQTWRLA